MDDSDLLEVLDGTLLLLQDVLQYQDVTPVRRARWEDKASQLRAVLARIQEAAA
jgi:hypothetical protein